MRALLFLALCGCAGGSKEKAAEYAAKLELCLQTTSTCNAYLECRSHIAKDFGREFHGKCASDAGAEHD